MNADNINTSITKPAEPTLMVRLNTSVRRYGKSVIAVVLMAHLFSLYLALLQTPPAQPLRLHLDTAWWLSLQALLVIAILRAQLRRQMLHQPSKYPPSILPPHHASPDHPTQRAALAPAWRAFRHPLSQPLSRSLVIFVLSMLSLQICIDLALQRPWDGTLLLRQALLLLLLFSLISAVYLLRHSWALQQQQQLALHDATSAAQGYQLQLLQQQLDPHFLFNNLNVLSALIHQDADRAEDFLSQFSEVYRYQIQHSVKSLVPLSLELSFATTYMRLLTQRFGNSVALTIAPDISLSSAHIYPPHLANEIAAPAPGQPNKMAQELYYLVPCALQLLLENAIKHNQFSEAEPLHIEITLKDHGLSISHRYRPKRYAVPSTGLGLHNLDQRCWHILRQHIQVGPTAEGNFVVWVPLSAYNTSLV
jgi:hypothetical protein